MSIWSPADEQRSEHHTPINIVSIITEIKGVKKTIGKEEESIWGTYDHIYVTWEDLDDNCIYTTDIIIPEEEAKSLKAKQQQTHYLIPLFNMTLCSHGECVVFVDLNDGNNNEIYKVFKGEVTHEYDQQLQQELGVNSMEDYFQKKHEIYQKRSLLMKMGTIFNNIDIKYASPTDYPVRKVSLEKDWDYVKLGLEQEYSQNLRCPCSVKAEWISINDKKAYKAEYNLPIEKIMDIYKDIDLKDDKKNAITFIFNFIPNGEANLYMQTGNHTTLLVDTHIKGIENDKYDHEAIEKETDSFERSNNVSNYYHMEHEQSFLPVLSKIDTQRYNYAVELFTKGESTICFVNGEQCPSSQKSLPEGFSLVQELSRKKGRQVYCFDWEETVSIFNKAYGEDKTQPGVLHLSFVKENELQAELVVNNNHYPFKPIYASLANTKQEDEDSNQIFWGAYYTSPKYHPVKVLRSRIMGQVWRKTPILNEYRNAMANYCIHTPKNWKLTSEIPATLDMYWISYVERKVYHTHGTFPESVKKELSKDKDKDRFELIHIRCLPQGDIALFLENDSYIISNEIQYTTKETHALDTEILEESGCKSMKEYFDQKDKELPELDYVKKNGTIAPLIPQYNKAYNYKKKIVLDNCDKKTYTPRFMLQYSDLCLENRITNEFQEETSHSVPQLFKMWLNTEKYRYLVEILFKEESIFKHFEEAYKGKEDAVGELYIHFNAQTEKIDFKLIVGNKAVLLDFYYFCYKWELATIKDDSKECITVYDDKDFKDDLKEIREGLFVGM